MPLNTRIIMLFHKKNIIIIKKKHLGVERYSKWGTASGSAKNPPCALLLPIFSMITSWVGSEPAGSIVWWCHRSRWKLMDFTFHHPFTILSSSFHHPFIILSPSFHHPFTILSPSRILCLAPIPQKRWSYLPFYPYLGLFPGPHCQSAPGSSHF